MKNRGDKKKNMRILQRIGVLVLTAVLVTVAGTWAAGLRQVEPEDPVGRHTEALTAEPASQGQTYTQTNGEDRQTEAEEKQAEEPEQEQMEEELPDLPERPDDADETDQVDSNAPEDPALPGGENQGTGDPQNPGDNSGGNDGPLNDQPKPGPTDDSELRLVTNLSNCILTYRQLQDDRLPFEAYIVNGTSDMYLRVKIQNSQTARNGDYLKADGRDYTTKLAREEHNRITIYIRQGNRTIATYTYVIYYIADKADAHDPNVGEHPPVITTNLDDWSGEMTNRHFTFLVGAKTYEGKRIYESNILVQMDGKTIKYPTGSGVYEYDLTFPTPASGNSEEHEVTVLAWDQEGNSAYRSFRVTYRFVDSGAAIGTCYVLLDMTTIGLGVTESYTYEIKQDEPAAYAVLAMLKDNGYDCDYGGSPDNGFYLRRISRGGMAAYASVPDNLWKKIGDDGLVKTGQRDANSVGEFDYTQGSGWMYSINGSLYAGKSLSSYYLSDGDTIYLRFTLAYGKDIGGGGDGFGVLSTYCGKWIGGTYIDQHQWQAARVTREPTCTAPGEQAVTCRVCGDTKEVQSIPAKGHAFRETRRKEPTETEAGSVTYTCANCGEQYQETLPPLGGGGDGEPQETVRYDLHSMLRWRIRP